MPMLRERPQRLASARRSVAGATLVAFFAVAPVTPSWLCLLALLALGAAIVADVGWRSTQRPTEALVAFTWVAITLLASSLLPILFRPLTMRGLTLIAQFAAVPLIAGAFWLMPRRRSIVDSIAIGATVGAIVAGAIALFQVVLLDGKRADAFGGNSIVFGALALMLAAVSLALSPPGAPVNAGLRSNRAVAFAVTMGLAATVLSTSRGAWLTLPVVLIVLGLQHRARVDRGQLTRWAVCGAGLAIALLSVAGHIVRRRASAAVSEIANYLDTGSASPAAGTSIGARFEAWRSAIDAFEAHPTTGIGWGNLADLYEQQARYGLRHPRIASFDHAHGQVLGSLASGGLLGAAAVVALIVVPALWFGRAVRSSSADQQRIGFAGILVVAVFSIVGLFESLLEHLVPLACFSVIVAALTSQLTVGSPLPVDTAAVDTAAVGSADSLDRGRPRIAADTEMG